MWVPPHTHRVQAVPHDTAGLTQAEREIGQLCHLLWFQDKRGTNEGHQFWAGPSGGTGWGHSGSLYPTPTACLSLRPTQGIGPQLPVLRLDPTGGVLHLEKEGGGDQKVGTYPKAERKAEKPRLSSKDSSGSRKEEGPGVKCETEIRGMLGSWRERQLRTLPAPPPLEPEPVKDGSKPRVSERRASGAGLDLRC